MRSSDPLPPPPPGWNLGDLFGRLEWVWTLTPYSIFYILTKKSLHIQNQSVMINQVDGMGNPNWLELSLHSKNANKYGGDLKSERSSYGNFPFAKVMRNLISSKSWNPEMLLKFWDFGLNFCIWPLNIPIKECYSNIRSEKILPWYFRGNMWGPPKETQNLIGRRR